MRPPVYSEEFLNVFLKELKGDGTGRLTMPIWRLMVFLGAGHFQRIKIYSEILSEGVRE